MTDDSLRAWLAEGQLEAVPEADQSNKADPPAWWDSDGSDNRAGEPRRKLLWVFAVLPWFIVAGLVWGRGTATQPAPAETPPSGTVPVASGTLPRAPRPLASGQPPLGPASPDQDAVDVSGPLRDPAFGALAALTVQHVLTGTDKMTGHQRYVDLALPETASWVGDVAIVQVAAVVLEGADGRWDKPRHARYAVPLRAGPTGPEVLGPPWALTSALDLTPVAKEFTPSQDEALAATVQRTLADAGYSDVRVRQLGRDPGIPGVLLAEVTAIAPGETSARAHSVWLRDDEIPMLLGAPAERTDLAGIGQ